MKTTNRIQRNGAAKATKSQAKTSRRTPDSFRIVIKDEAGRNFADFEISKAMHAAIVRDAQSKGISMMQWIEDAVSKSLEKHQASAAKSLTNLQSAKHRMAFRELEDSVEAAKALIMVLAEKSEVSGLMQLTTNTILKLNADLATAGAAFNPATESNREVAS